MKKVLFTVVLLLLLSKCFCQNSAYPIVSISVSNDSIYKSQFLGGPLTIYANTSKAVIGDKRIGVKILGVDTLVNKIQLSDSVIIIKDGNKNGFVTLNVQPDTFQVGNKKINVQIYPISAGLTLSKENTEEVIIADYNSCAYIDESYIQYFDLKNKLYYVEPTFLKSLILSTICKNWRKNYKVVNHDIKEDIPYMNNDIKYSEYDTLYIINEFEQNKYQIYLYEKALELNRFKHGQYEISEALHHLVELKFKVLDWEGAMYTNQKLWEQSSYFEYSGISRYAVLMDFGYINYKMKNYVNAINYYKEAEANPCPHPIIESDEKTSLCLSAIYQKIGDCKFELNQYNEAIKNYDIADSDNFSLSQNSLLKRGICKFKLRRFQEALIDIDLCLSDDSLNKAGERGDINDLELLNDSDLISAFLILGNAHLELRNYIEAKIDFKHALSIDAYNLKVLSGLGLTYVRLNDNKNAIDAFDLIITLNPNSEKIYALRGLCKIKLGDKNGGCLDLKKSLDLGYTQANEIINTYCKN
jgi:tetratricopeptide (TPR) repeat protein